MEQSCRHIVKKQTWAGACCQLMAARRRKSGVYTSCQKKWPHEKGIRSTATIVCTAQASPGRKICILPGAEDCTALHCCCCCKLVDSFGTDAKAAAGWLMQLASAERPRSPSNNINHVTLTPGCLKRWRRASTGVEPHRYQKLDPNRWIAAGWLMPAPPPTYAKLLIWLKSSVKCRRQKWTTRFTVPKQGREHRFYRLLQSRLLLAKVTKMIVICT